MSEESALIDAARSTAQAAATTTTTVANLIVNILVLGGKAIVFGGKTSAKAAVMAVRVRNAIYYGKWHGRTNYRRLLDIKGDNLAYFEIGTQDKETLKKIRAVAKKSGLLFTQLPDFNLEDGKTHFCFSANDLPVFNVFLRAYNEGVKSGIFQCPISVIGEEEYARTAFGEDGLPTKEMAKLEESAREELKKEAEKKKEKEETPPKKRRPPNRGEESRRVKEISVNEVLYRQEPESGRSIIRVPGTQGKVHFLLSPKDPVRTITPGNLAVGIDPEKQYARCDKYGNPTGETIPGSEILRSFNLEKKKEFFHAVNKKKQIFTGAGITVDNGNVIARTEYGYILDIPGGGNLAAFVPNRAVAMVNRQNQLVLDVSANAYVFDKGDLSKQQEARISSFAKALTTSREKNLKAIKNLKAAVAERGQNLRLTLGDDRSGSLTDFLKSALRR